MSYNSPLFGYTMPFFSILLLINHLASFQCFPITKSIMNILEHIPSRNLRAFL